MIIKNILLKYLKKISQNMKKYLVIVMKKINIIY